MNRVAEIADYLLSVDFARTDDRQRTELIGEIVDRWPDVTQHDLEASFQIAILETAAQFADAVADRCDDLAVAVARATAANATPA